MRHVQVPLIVAAAVLLAGCGGSSQGRTGSEPPRAGVVPLLRAPKRAGEIVLSGDASPRTVGPIRFVGTYRVRFQQYAPEDPRLDFTRETAFVADLERIAGTPTIRLFRKAAARGDRVVTLRGRYYVDVSFGDYPFALRFSPVRR